MEHYNMLMQAQEAQARAAYLRHQQLAAVGNMASRHVDMMFGIRTPDPFLVLPPEAHRVNQVNIGGDNNGLVNQGVMRHVEVSIDNARNNGLGALADILDRLKTTVLATDELDDLQKRDVVEGLGAIASEAVKPAD